jgi:hypothetical protein
MFVPGRSAAADKPISLWLYTDRIDELHAVLKTRQLRRARAILAGKTPAEPEVSFRQDLYTAFYGQREFCIRDPDGYDLNFAQPL